MHHHSNWRGLGKAEDCAPPANQLEKLQAQEILENLSGVVATAIGKSPVTCENLIGNFSFPLKTLHHIVNIHILIILCCMPATLLYAICPKEIF